MNIYLDGKAKISFDSKKSVCLVKKHEKQNVNKIQKFNMKFFGNFIHLFIHDPMRINKSL